jgi:hypothetical protein
MRRTYHPVWTRPLAPSRGHTAVFPYRPSLARPGYRERYPRPQIIAWFISYRWQSYATTYSQTIGPQPTVKTAARTKVVGCAPARHAAHWRGGSAAWHCRRGHRRVCIGARTSALMQWRGRHTAQQLEHSLVPSQHLSRRGSAYFASRSISHLPSVCEDVHE